MIVRLPAKVWEPAPVGFTPAVYGSVYPPIQKLPDGRLVVDQSRRQDGSYDVAVFDNRDDPAIGQLPLYCPRSVRQLFRREWRLRFLRATEAASILADIDRALHDWAEFNKVRPC